MSALTLTPHESVSVVEHTPDRLVVDVTYVPGGKRPPSHVHPAQDERFEITAGRIGVKLPGERRICAAGDVLEIPRGTPHSMWNAGEEEARAVWITTPAGRTLEWWRALDALNRTHGRLPGPAAFALYLVEFQDVFQITAPFWVVRALARFGRADLKSLESPV